MLKRATPDTRFYIDYDWWDKSDLDLKTYLFTRLDIGQDINLESETDEVDLVDAATGEVTRVDGFQYVVQAYFSQLPEDFVTRTSLVDAGEKGQDGATANRQDRPRDGSHRIGQQLFSVGPEIFYDCPLADENSYDTRNEKGR